MHPSTAQARTARAAAAPSPRGLLPAVLLQHAQQRRRRRLCLRVGGVRPLCLAVGETVIVLTPLLIPIETPDKGTRGAIK